MNTRISVALLFILLYGVALLRPALPLLDYYLKMETYLEQCTNKDRPELHCNGQCILMQKIKAFEGETDTPAPIPPAPVKINFHEYPIGFIDSPRLLTPDIRGKIKSSSAYLAITPQPFHAEIFHPPAHS